MGQYKYIASTICHRLDKRIWRYICILVLYFILADGLLDGPEPIVETKWGILQGKWSRSIRDQRIANFLGIPYALPPVGDLRFRSPQRWNYTWTTIRNATVDGNMCSQISGSKISGSEDCLYLNIFIPYIPGIQRMKLPVLVFVHSGAYYEGSSNSKELSPDYLMDQDIILVTVNYRLNIFGFFSTMNQVSPGNYGLKDMKMALEWIQENIHSFNGNPESVTLMGASAGAALTHLLALSNKTEGLFHRYILLSGSALSPWAYNYKKYRQICLKLVKLVGCQSKKDDSIIAINESDIDNSDVENEKKRSNNISVSYKDYNEGYIKDDEEIVKCMRTVDARQLLKMLKHFYGGRANRKCVFSPTLEDNSEDAILTMHPWKIIKDGLFRDIPAIMQVVKGEGLTKTFEFFTDPTLEKEMIENFEGYIFDFLETFKWNFNADAFIPGIQDFYFNGNISLGLKGNITEMLSDGTVIWPILKAARYQSEIGNSSVYFSFFAYEGTFSHTFIYAGSLAYYGVCHNDDMNYLFPVLNNMCRNLMLNNTESDFMIIKIMTEMWANFMKDGVPKAWMIPAWPNYRDYHQFMRFGNGKSTDIVVQTDFLCDRMEFWEKLQINGWMKYTNGWMNDTIIDDSPDDTSPVNDDPIEYKLTIYLVLLIITLLCVLKYY
ncbi:Esterase FE4 [Camponotus floridanus]|uniref:Esterase FE4 n=2 Tax=Camponotus floridanus TaxID=104421 RepID=E1ZYE4_CAMFO|nr:Esterase FE4 [Camponotus floridanus]